MELMWSLNGMWRLSEAYDLAHAIHIVKSNSEKLVRDMLAHHSLRLLFSCPSEPVTMASEI